MMSKTLQATGTKFWSSKWTLSILAGLLLGLSYPPLPFPFLIFPAWVLLFRLAELSESNRGAACWGYVSFVIWNLITTYWLMMATVAGGIAAILANSAVMTIPFVLQRKIQQRIKSPWIIALLHAAIWISYEFLHHQWDLAWPWLTIGNAWSNVPGLIQYISLTGYWSISFWVLATASLAWQAIRSGEQQPAYGSLAVVFIFPFISLVQYHSTGFSPEDHIEVVVVQPNFDTYHTYGGYKNIVQTQQVLIDLSDSLRTDSTDALFWPENAVREPIASKEIPGSVSQRVKDQLLGRAKDWNLSIIAGATYFDYFPPDSVPPLARSPEEEPYLFYNAALGFYPDSSYQVYRKRNLVPLVERMPFVHFLNSIDIFGLVNWRDQQIYGKGHQLNPFRVDGTTTPALVCYDSVFPNWVRQYVANGAGFITIITNDGWWGETSGHHQHFAYARLRAIESRRWIVRSANNGISGIINPYGNIKVKTDYWKKTAFRYDVPVLDKKTLYTRWGDWFPISMLVITVLGSGFMFIRNSENESSDNT